MAPPLSGRRPACGIRAPARTPAGTGPSRSEIRGWAWRRNSSRPWQSRRRSGEGFAGHPLPARLRAPPAAGAHPGRSGRRQVCPPPRSGSAERTADRRRCRRRTPAATSARCTRRGSPIRRAGRNRPRRSSGASTWRVRSAPGAISRRGRSSRCRLRWPRTACRSTWPTPRRSPTPSAWRTWSAFR